MTWCNYIGHAYVHSCPLINFQYKPISLQYSCLSVERPIRVDWVLYKPHWEFSINKKTIPIRLYRYDFPLFPSCLMQTLNTYVEGHSHAYDKEFSTFKHFEKKFGQTTNRLCFLYPNKHPKPIT